MTRTRYLSLALLILLLYLGLRLHQLLALPLFIDETLHADRAVSVWRGSPLWFGVHGKYLGSWWVALFYPFPPQPWLIRAAVLLLTPLSAAAVMALAQRLYGRSAGIYAGVLAVFAPMLFFFDRMSLADTTLHVTLALFVLSLFHLLDSRSLRWRLALLAGALLALSVMAKASALAILPLPVIAVWLLPRGWRVTDRLKALAGVSGAALVIWLPLLIAMRLRGINYLGVPIAEHSAGAGSILLPERITGNLLFLLDGLLVYFGAVPLLIAAGAMIAGVIAHPRGGLVLGLAVGGPALGIILIGEAGVSMRYWLGIIPLALALIGGGLAVIGKRLAGGGLVRHLPAALIGLWVLAAAVPFIHSAYTNPTALPLPDKDRLEYLEADSAGTMLPELADFLAAEAARRDDKLVVTGAISQCYGLSLYLPADADIMLDCPRVFSPEGRGAALDQHVAALAAQHERYYVIFEKAGIVSLEDVTTTTLEPVAAFARPGSRVIISVYQPAQ
jgi:4-amino-4-deoxy-L-arabinose transferase-like glycosyltransferase